VLVISDFADSVSKGKQGELRNAFTTNGIRVVGIGIFDHHVATEEERLGPGNLLDLATETGGMPMIVDSLTDVPNILKWLFDAIGKFYVLRITLSVPPKKPERLNVRLMADDGKKNKGISLYYPDKVSQCHRQSSQ